MNDNPFVLKLDDEKAGLALVGGKAANLARLAQAGFPVPGAFLITTQAYRDFVAANQLQPVIQQALANADLENPDDLQAASHTIRVAFTQGELPAELAGILAEAYEVIGAPPAAVRSSATAEDLPDMSFAGQQDTYLNVIGIKSLLQSVIACWGSLWTARAIGYRARNDIPPEDVALAVVVQEMVQSQVSGVLFTANPLTGLRSETAIDATLGLGEALVSGLVEPDHFVIDRTTMRVTSREIGAKKLVIESETGGGVRHIERAEDALPVLADPVLLELAELGERVEAEYGGQPQDIEWAWANDKLYLLQSRPITSLYPLPVGVSADPLWVMGSFGAMQGMLDPMTTMGRDVIPRLIVAMMTVFGRHEDPDNQNVVLEAGDRIFANITGFVRHPRGRPLIMSILGAIEPRAGQALATVLDDPRLAVQHSRPKLRTIAYTARFFGGTLVRLAAGIIDPDASRHSAWRMVDGITVDVKTRAAVADNLPAVLDLVDYAVGQKVPYALPQLVPRIAAGMAPMNLLLRMSRPLPDGTALVLAITRGMPHNVTTEMDLALWRTAQAIRTDEASLSAFTDKTAVQLAASFQAKTLPSVAQAAVTQFMDRYGVRGLAEIDLGRPRWRENPAPVMQSLQSYLSIKDPEQAPDAVFARGAAAADAAINELATQLRAQPRGRTKAHLARKAATRMRAIAGLRELPKWTIISIMGILRPKLLAEGEKMVQAGIVARADDIFFLRIAELAEIAAGERRPWQQIVSERRAVYDREMRRQQAPRILLSDGRAFYEGAGMAADEEGVITGSPVSPGLVEGAVRVVLDPNQAGLQPGEIMVCPGTDPSWTPLFLAAGGLVMEVGGMMTHGSVVAREYGIPAVVGVHEATTRLQTGQRVRVDGASGRIWLLNGESGSGEANALDHSSLAH
ncbi:MAG: hypothetical protein J5I90_09195 [Caldilineales bacterium]|nr:hypothetical protein [Caldilineales bacterium]